MRLPRTGSRPEDLSFSIEGLQEKESAVLDQVLAGRLQLDAVYKALVAGIGQVIVKFVVVGHKAVKDISALVIAYVGVFAGLPQVAVFEVFFEGPGGRVFRVNKIKEL